MTELRFAQHEYRQLDRSHIRFKASGQDPDSWQRIARAMNHQSWERTPRAPRVRRALSWRALLPFLAVVHRELHREATALLEAIYALADDDGDVTCPLHLSTRVLEDVCGARFVTIDPRQDQWQRTSHRAANETDERDASTRRARTAHRTRATKLLVENLLDEGILVLATDYSAGSHGRIYRFIGTFEPTEIESRTKPRTNTPRLMRARAKSHSQSCSAHHRARIPATPAPRSQRCSRGPPR